MPELEMTGGGGSVLVGGGLTDSEGPGGDFGRSRTVMGHVPGTVGAPGDETPTGDPINSFPVGRMRIVTVDLSTASGGRSKSAPITVPGWAQSYNAYARAAVFGASTVVQFTEGPPSTGVLAPFATDVTLTNTTRAARFKPCTPGTEIVATTTTGTAGADEDGEIIVYFSANPAV